MADLESATNNPTLVAAADPAADPGPAGQPLGTTDTNGPSTAATDVEIELPQPERSTCAGIALAIALADHATAFLVGAAAVLAGVSLEMWLPWCLGLGVASCLARLAELLRDSSIMLEKRLVSPPFIYHSCQMMFIFLVVGVFQPDARPEDPDIIITEAILSTVILMGDVAIIFLSFRRKTQLQHQALKRAMLEMPAPEVERFEFCPEIEVSGDAQAAETNNCTICLAEICAQEECARLLPCRHTFHAACLDRWLETHRQRPWCPFRCSGDNSQAVDAATIGAVQSDQVEVMSV
mmetsp:Transcript_52146/g.124236  ORF Transcript_52146/g.124236 Transcript_52146/m.124236 type:complete len:294 (+) Transcript_52146:79-960(+)